MASIFGALKFSFPGQAEATILIVKYTTGKSSHESALYFPSDSAKNGLASMRVTTAIMG